MQEIHTESCSLTKRRDVVVVESVGSNVWMLEVDDLTSSRKYDLGLWTKMSALVSTNSLQQHIQAAAVFSFADQEETHN